MDCAKCDQSLYHHVLRCPALSGAMQCATFASKAHSSGAWALTSASAEGLHQVPPQPLQFPTLVLQYPEAQDPPQVFDHLQQLGAGAGVGCGVGGAGVGCGVGGVGGTGVGSGVGAGVGCGVGPPGRTLTSEQPTNCSTVFA